MAKVRKTILGKISGALGDLVFRIKNGKNFVSTRPVGSVRKDAASQERMKRFGLAVKLANTITMADMIKYFWMKVSPSGMSANNFIVKLNYDLIDKNGLGETIRLMPSLGFSLSVDRVIIQPDNVDVILNPIGSVTDIDVEVEKKIACAGILYLTNPVTGNDVPYVLFSLRSSLTDLDLENPLSFQIGFSDIVRQQYGTYDSAKVHLTLVTFDENGNPVRYSNTITGSRE